MPRILLVEDDEIMRISIYDRLLKFGWQVDQAGDGLTARELFDKNEYNLVISDIRMPKLDGLALLHHIIRHSPETDVIIMTAHGSVSDAIDCLRKGATDYILKPFDMDNLIIRVNRLLDTQAVKAKYELLKAYCRQEDGRELIGSSRAMQQVHELIDQVAPTESTVLITGESGTGKELAARAIHRKSRRSSNPFVVINCAAIPESLTESELFGHERGSFTGAERFRKGKFELADNGTLLLDELGDLPEPIQAKLLRVLQEGKFERLGGNKLISVDVRVLACTSKNLQQEVDKGKFRQDLLYRLEVIPMVMPPLRDHREDIEELCTAFLDEFNRKHRRTITISKEAISCLCHYDFPGNIRELRNLMERASVLCSDPEISLRDLPIEITQSSIKSIKTDFKKDFSLSTAIAQTEKRCLIAALKESQGNKTKASKLLGISRKNLWEKLKQHQVI